MIVISLCSELYPHDFFLPHICFPRPTLIPLEWKYAGYFAQGQWDPLTPLLFLVVVVEA